MTSGLNSLSLGLNQSPTPRLHFIWPRLQFKHLLKWFNAPFPSTLVASQVQAWRAQARSITFRPGVWRGGGRRLPLGPPFWLITTINVPLRAAAVAAGHFPFLLVKIVFFSPTWPTYHSYMTIDHLKQFSAIFFSRSQERDSICWVAQEDEEQVVGGNRGALVSRNYWLVSLRSLHFWGNRILT